MLKEVLCDLREYYLNEEYYVNKVKELILVLNKVLDIMYKIWYNFICVMGLYWFDRVVVRMDTSSRRT